MSGSYKHLFNDAGAFTMDYIDNLGDAHEACEQCVWLIDHLAGGDQATIEAALERGYATGFQLPPKGSGNG